MKRPYLLPDPHFCERTHKHYQKIRDWCQRPANFNDRLFKGLSRLTTDDILICLGDICFGNNDLLHQMYIMPLKCTKILVRGNHDKQTNSYYYKHGWDFVCTTFRDKYFGKNILFSHKPKVWDGYYDYNIHGHFHNLPIERWETELTAVMTDKHILMSCENSNYQPVSLNSLIDKLTKENNESTPK